MESFAATFNPRQAMVMTHTQAKV